MELGFTLSCEEHRPRDLVAQAQRAEAAGFTFASISDHFHPWVERQGQSPFAWTVIGGVAATTSRLKLMTGVTCPLIRYHPALVAQMAATAGDMMPGRFLLGLGSGEALNEHVVADRWPPPEVRQEMLWEAVEVIRLLWRGGMQTYRGKHYLVENARIYTLPSELPPILVAASGPKAARLAAEKADGLVTTSPDEAVLKAFAEAGGADKPKAGQVHVCWASTDQEAAEIAEQTWPNSAVPSNVTWEIPLPEHFESLAGAMTPGSVAGSIACGPDPEKHLESIKKYRDAGFDMLSVHQVGPDQEGFFRFYEREVLPRLATAGVAG
jgi:coenzyme F420-dependent glucose-6-phosphate dehydrogenase